MIACAKARIRHQRAKSSGYAPTDEAAGRFPKVFTMHARDHNLENPDCGQ
jgi:hypothetical protein